jgi:hypothetical protein
MQQHEHEGRSAILVFVDTLTIEDKIPQGYQVVDTLRTVFAISKKDTFQFAQRDHQLMPLFYLALQLREQDKEAKKFVAAWHPVVNRDLIRVQDSRGKMIHPR